MGSSKSVAVSSMPVGSCSMLCAWH